MPASSKLKDPLIAPLDPEFVANPYPTWAHFRQEAPFWWSEKGKYWLVTRYADANEILMDRRFGKNLQNWKEINFFAKLLPPVKHAMKARSAWMLNMDPPDHTRMRSLVNKAFTPATVAALTPHIESIANSLIDAVLEKRQIDLIHEFAFPLPITVIAHMLGVPPEDREVFRKFSNMLTSTLEVTPSMRRVGEGNRAIDGLIAYLRPLVAERRKNPKDDLISALIAAEEQGNKLTEEELLQNCVLLLVAGHETTVNLIGNGILDLLRNPDQFDLIKADPSLIPSAVQEVLRYDSPIQMVRRLAGEDVEFSGQKIKQGDMLTVMIGACNRDPAHFENPDLFDIRRPAKRNLAFGQGIHHCLGSSLAEVEGRVAFETIAKRLPDLKLKEGKLEWRQSVLFRGVQLLPATW